MAKFVLVATAKNEGPYILEWVAHHLLVGFTDIIIFQNDSDDYTDAILKSLQALGIVNYKYNNAKRGAHQARAYLRASRQPEYLAADWAMALDLDEFLDIRVGHNTLPDLMRAMPDADQIHLNWVRFGNNGHQDLDDTLVTSRFTRTQFADRIEGGFEPFKTLFSCDAFARPGIHKPRDLKIEGDKVRTANGSGLFGDAFQVRNFQCTDPHLRNLAQVNHYIVRDVSSFVIKSHKGSAHQANRPVDSKYWLKRNDNRYSDTRLAQRTVSLQGKMDALNDMSGGVLNDLRKQAIEHHKQKIAEIIKDDEYKKLFDYCVANTGGMPE